MRTLKTIVDNLIGREYKEGGRGPLVFDCFGLLLWLFREAKGIELPDPLNAVPGRGKAIEAVTGLSELFVELSPRDVLQPLDVLYYTTPGSLRCPDHLLIVEDDRHAVHAQFGQVTRVGLDRYRRLPKLVCYRAKALQ
jgi:hypothetical protein